MKTLLIWLNDYWFRVAYPQDYGWKLAEALGGDIFKTELRFGAMAAVGALVLWARRSVGWPLAMAWGYFVGRGVWEWLNPWVPFATFNSPAGPVDIAFQLANSIGQATFLLLVLPWAVCSIPDEIFRHWRRAFLAFGVVECFFIAYGRWGFMNASSFDAGLVAVTLPLAPLWLFPLYLGAISACERSGAAVAMLAGQFVVFGLTRLNWKWAAAAFVSAGAFLFAAPHFFHVHTFDLNNRTEHWPVYFDWWCLNASRLFGTGTGSFFYLGPAIYSFGPGMWLQLHSDWFCFLFEGGVVGFALVAAAYLSLLIQAVDRPRLLATLAGLGLFMLVYHPFRFMPSMLFIACVVREVIAERPSRPANGLLSLRRIKQYFLARRR